LHPTNEASSNITQVAQAIESGEPLDVEQIQIFERIIKWEIDALSDELKGKSTSSRNAYPNNLTVSNHYEYIVLPTLVYELEYPRSEEINWYYAAEKLVAVFGVLLVMNLVSQAYIYPIVVRTIDMKEAGIPLLERLQHFPKILSDLIFPFMLEYMMVRFPPLSPTQTLIDKSPDLVRDMGMYSQSPCRTHLFRGPWLLCRLVELSLMGPIRTRLEPTCAQLPPTSRLPLFHLLPEGIPTHSDPHYFLSVRMRARTRHVVPVQKAEGISVVLTDDANSACAVESNSMVKGEKDVGELYILGGDIYGPEFAM
jgi:hypothetical protein